MVDVSIKLNADAGNVSAVTKTAADDLAKIGSTAKTASDAAAQAFKTLGIRASDDIVQAAKDARAALNSLSSAGLGEVDMSHARAAARAQLAELRKEYEGFKLPKIDPPDTNGWRGSVADISHLGTTFLLAGQGAKMLVGAVIGMTAPLVEAGLAAEKINRQLTFTTGSSAGAAREMEFLRNTTATLGINFNAAAAGYGKLAAASKGTVLEGKATRDVFEGIAKASVVLGMSTDETSGALMALQQMISKGSVQSEELKGQLGERLPGAFQIAARAMGVTTAELGKMLESGMDVAEFMPKFSAELNKMFSSEAGSASASAQANINRMANAWEGFKTSLADSGVLGVVSNAVRILAAGMDSINTGAFRQMARLQAELENAKLIRNGEKEMGEDTYYTDKRIENIKNEINAIRAKTRAEQESARVKAESNAAAETKAAAAVPGAAWNSAARENSLANRYNPDVIKAAEDKRIKERGEFNKKYRSKNDELKLEIARAKTLFSGEELVVAEKAIREKLKVSAGKTVVDKSFVDATVEAYKDYGKAIESIIGIQSKAELSVKNLTAAEQVREALIQSGAWDKLSAGAQKVVNAYVATANATTAAAEAQKAYNAAVADIDKVTRSLQDRASGLAFETETMGMTQEAIYNLLAARAEESAYRNSFANDNGERVQALKNEAQAYRDLAIAQGKHDAAKSISDTAKKAADDSSKAWTKFADDIERALTDSLMRGFEAGKDGGKVFVDSIKATLKTAALKIVIQAIVDPVKGTLQGLTGTGGATGGSLLSSGSSLLSSASNLYSNGLSSMGFGAMQAGVNTAAYTTFGSMGMEQAAMLAAQDSVFGAAGTAATLEAAGSTLAASAAAAMPYVAAAIAVYSLLSGPGGGPKTEGRSAYNPITNKIDDTLIGSEGQRNGGGGKTLSDQLATALGETIQVSIEKLGGNAAGITSKFFYNQDPQGDAPSQVWATVNKDGKQLAQYGGDFGRSPEAFNAGVAEETNRALVGALKSVDLVDWADGMLKSIDPLTASAAELTTALSNLNGMATLVDVFGKLGVSADKVSLDLVTAMGGFDKAGTLLSGYYDSMYTESEKQAMQAEQLTASFAALGQAVPATRQGFRDLVDSLDLTTVSGEVTYAALLSLAPAFAQVIDAVGATTTALATAASKASASAKYLSQPQSLARAKADILATYANVNFDELAKLGSAGIKSAMVDFIGTLTNQSDVDNITRLSGSIDTFIASVADTEAAVSSAAQGIIDSAKSMADTAYNNLATAAQAEIDRINKQLSIDLKSLDDQATVQQTALDTAKTLLDVIKSLENSLTDAIDKLRGSISDPSQTIAEARGKIDDMLQAAWNGSLPDQTALAKALGTVTGDAAGNYATALDYQRAQAVQAGKLDTLNSLVGRKGDSTTAAVDEATRVLDAIKAQRDIITTAAETSITSINDQLAIAKQQLDALNGISSGVLTLAEAFNAFANSLHAAAQATGQVAPLPATNSTYTSAGGATYDPKTGAWTNKQGSGSESTAQVKADAYSLYAQGGASAVFAGATSVGLTMSDIDRVAGLTAGTAASATQADMLRELTSGPAGDMLWIYNKAKSLGIRLSDVDRLGGLPSGTAGNWATANGLPTFAVGANYIPSDMVAQIHEGERIIPAADNRALMSRLNGNSNVIDITPLIAEIAALRAEVRAVAGHTGKTARTLERVMPDGDALQTRAVA